MIAVRDYLLKHYLLYKISFLLKYEIPTRLLGDRRMIIRMFKRRMGYIPNLENPQTLAEKMQWIKINDRHDFNTLAADKYRIRDYYRKNFGENHLVPLLKKLDSWRDVTLENMPNEPYVIKANAGSGTWQIVRNPKAANIKELQTKCKIWMNCNYFYKSLEWQYKNIKPCIIIEKLLTDSNGRLPTDYKLHYFNGELQFVYCVIDREGEGYRALFTKEWEYLPFQWISVRKHMPIKQNVYEPKPQNLDKMIKYGNIISRNFKYYVRVDFYEVDGRLYFGEITLHHGSGMNNFYPAEYEEVYNKLLNIGVS